MPERTIENDLESLIPIDEIRLIGASREELKNSPVIQCAKLWGDDHPDRRVQKLALGASGVWHAMAPDTVVVADTITIGPGGINNDAFQRALKQTPGNQPSYVYIMDGTGVFRGHPLSSILEALSGEEEPHHVKLRNLLEPFHDEIVSRLSRLELPKGGVILELRSGCDTTHMQRLQALAHEHNSVLICSDGSPANALKTAIYFDEHGLPRPWASYLSFPVRKNHLRQLVAPARAEHIPISIITKNFTTVAVPSTMESLLDGVQAAGGRFCHIQTYGIADNSNFHIPGFGPEYGGPRFKRFDEVAMSALAKYAGKAPHPHASILFMTALKQLYQAGMNQLLHGFLEYLAGEKGLPCRTHILQSQRVFHLQRDADRLRHYFGENTFSFLVSNHALTNVICFDPIGQYSVKNDPALGFCEVRIEYEVPFFETAAQKHELSDLGAPQSWDNGSRLFLEGEWWKRYLSPGTLWRAYQLMVNSPGFSRAPSQLSYGEVSAICQDRQFQQAVLEAVGGDIFCDIYIGKRDEHRHPAMSMLPEEWLAKFIAAFGVTTKKTHSRTFVRTEPKIGRNDPCYCGSGQKYKRCCGKVIA